MQNIATPTCMDASSKLRGRSPLLFLSHLGWAYALCSFMFFPPALDLVDGSRALVPKRLW